MFLFDKICVFKIVCVFLNEFVSLFFPILFDVNKGGEEYAYVLFCFKEIAGPNKYQTHSKIQRIMDLGGAYNLGGALHLLNIFATQNNINISRIVFKTWLSSSKRGRM